MRTDSMASPCCSQSMRPPSECSATRGSGNTRGSSSSALRASSTTLPRSSVASSVPLRPANPGTLSRARTPSPSNFARARTRSGRVGSPRHSTLGSISLPRGESSSIRRRASPGSGSSSASSASAGSSSWFTLSEPSASGPQVELEIRRRQGGARERGSARASVRRARSCRRARCLPGVPAPRPARAARGPRRDSALTCASATSAVACRSSPASSVAHRRSAPWPCQTSTG